MNTIAWDIDDSLNDFTFVWFYEWFLKREKNITLNYSELIENPPSRILGLSDAEYLKSLDLFRVSETAGKIKPLSQVLQWFKEYGEKTRHIALTATPMNSAPISAFWVMKYYGRWIRTFHVIPSKRVDFPVPEYDRSKIEFLNWFGKVDIVVDDNEVNIEVAKNAGYRTIGIKQPWNRIENSIEDALDQLTEYICGKPYHD